MHCAADPAEGAVLTAELIYGDDGPVTLDSDGIVVVRLTAQNKRILRLTNTTTGDRRDFDLSGISLESATSSDIVDSGLVDSMTLDG